MIGGEVVKNGEAPYQVALLRSGAFSCGGIWIGPKRVLTAAHCVYEFKDRPQLFRIRYATLYRNSGAELPVSRIILHPKYNTSTFDYDVAVLCTETPFTAGVNAQVVEIAAAAPVAGTRAVSTGWGRIHADPHVNMPLYLQRAGDLAVLDEAECQRHSPEVAITGRMLCAFSSVQAICTGDSGGPLVNTATGQLIGVASWTSNWCLHPSHPSVFARLDTLRSWILASCEQEDSVEEEEEDSEPDGAGGGSSTAERLRPALWVISVVVAFNPLLRVVDFAVVQGLSKLWSW